MNSDAPNADPAVDPVCGMTVDPEIAPFRSERKGRIVNFCCEGCKMAFDRKPALYESS